MKQKINITIDEKTLKLIGRIIKEGLYRNKSHFVEYSINKLLREGKNVKTR